MYIAIMHSCHTNACIIAKILSSCGCEIYQQGSSKRVGRNRARLCVEQNLVPPLVVPIICAAERHTSAAIPNPNEELFGREQRLPSNLMLFTFFVGEGI